MAKVKNVTKRDMATSPHLGVKSNKILIAQQQQKPQQQYPAAAKSPTIKSRTSRSAATSPGVDPKQHRPELSPLCISQAGHRGIGDGPRSPKPTEGARTLRSARSLSPRPPIRHQHAITVSDENEVVCVKLYGNDLSAGDDKGDRDRSAKRCQSEHASPNVFEERRFLYDEKVITTNRSTGCLVYVPFNPWLRMSDEDLPVNYSKNTGNSQKQQRKRAKGATSAGASSSSTQFVFPVAKSQSKPNMLDYDDPWVWQGDQMARNDRRGDDARKRQSETKKHSLTRQAKSLQSKVSTDMGLNLPYLSASGAATSTGDVRSRGSRAKEVAAKGSSTTNVSTLQVTMNLQPRHSFSSSPSQRDDELPLNIRRLSEQIRHSSSNRSPMGSNTVCTGSALVDGINTADRAIRKLGKISRQAQGTGGDLTAKEALLETTC